MALIVDTGPLVALLDATDRWPGAFRSPLAASDAGCLELLDLPVRWLLRAGDLADRYRDPLGLVDATVLAPTEMLAETKLARSIAAASAPYVPRTPRRGRFCPEVEIRCEIAAGAAGPTEPRTST